MFDRKKYGKEYREKHKLETKERMRRFFSIYGNRVNRSIYQREWRNKTRLHIIELLGNKCSRCGFTDIRVLQIDHVNGGGTKEKRETGAGNYYSVVLNKILSGSKDYQLLCANCNWIKKYEMGEHVPIKYK